MAILPLNLARVSNQLRTSVAQNAITRTQSNLLAVQNQMTTGKRLNAPSDDPGDGAVVQQLRKTLEQRQAYAGNLQFAASHLSQVDTTLADITDLLQQAENVASANVGSDVTADSRSAAAEIVKGLYQQMLTLGNKQFNGTYLFAGDKGDRSPFIETAGGIQFIGSENILANTFDENTVLTMGINGAEVFGAVSTRVQGSADLTPAVTVDTRLSDLRGATSDGVRAGSIRISNGTTSAVVDLSGADTLGDVIDAIDNSGLAGITAAIAADGVSLLISGGAADDMTISEVGGGSTAADLGILQAAPAGVGNPVDGANLYGRITPFTLLADLAPGSTPDMTSGLTLTAGNQTKTISFAGLSSVQEMLNAINGAGLGVQAKINTSGNGIDIINVTSGLPMSIGENGGTTATDMGLRSLHAGTALAELNEGKGVRSVAGTDMRLTRMDGTTFDVDISGLNTIQNVIDAINTADGGGGLTASMNPAGNGIRLVDSTGGAGSINVAPLNGSSAALDLGLLEAPAGNQINGKDVNPVNTPGIFGNLARLRDALSKSDPAGITAAAEAIQADYSRVVRVRGTTGARVQELESRQQHLEDQNLATTAFLSTLEDTDFTDAVTRFQTLQTSLQAAMQTTARMLNLSLMDFLG